jgi:predicted peroxiredoxin
LKGRKMAKKENKKQIQVDNEDDTTEFFDKLIKKG